MENLGINVLKGSFKGKRVLITGHTGFKGSWLTAWLLRLGADVCGYSIDIPTKPSLFEELELEKKIDHHLADIRDQKTFSKVLKNFNPDFVFHLAAQPIVSTSYSSPVETISTNVMGTTIVLDSLKKWNQDCVAIIITSDKCYENVEWIWGYKETDVLGGKDIYSSSKGAAELIFHSYYQSFFSKDECKVKLASARAGNVIGGGDWAKDRIVVDCMKAWAQGEQVEIRSPNATRPWQHVLEPLSGYLWLAICLSKRPELSGESYNFGPKLEKTSTVFDLLTDLSKIWNITPIEKAFIVTDTLPFNEAGLLKLNCEKALSDLNWEANMQYLECIQFVGQWYLKFYQSDCDIAKFTDQQISDYENIAQTRGLVWAS